MSMLDDMENGDSVEVPNNGASNAAGEIKRKRGRPPGSKNKPKGEAVESMAASLENAIRGIFALLGYIAGWFGYVQTAELTDNEAKEGARAFAPIAAKIPWFADAAIWIGAPVWLLVTMRKKFVRKSDSNASNPGSNRGNNPVAIGEGSRNPASDNQGETVGSVSAGR